MNKDFIKLVNDALEGFGGHGNASYAVIAKVPPNFRGLSSNVFLISDGYMASLHPNRACFAHLSEALSRSQRVHGATACGVLFSGAKSKEYFERSAVKYNEEMAFLIGTTLCRHPLVQRICKRVTFKRGMKEGFLLDISKCSSAEMYQVLYMLRAPLELAHCAAEAYPIWRKAGLTPTEAAYNSFFIRSNKAPTITSHTCFSFETLNRTKFLDFCFGDKRLKGTDHTSTPASSPVAPAAHTALSGHDRKNLPTIAVGAGWEKKSIVDIKAWVAELKAFKKGLKNA